MKFERKKYDHLEGYTCTDYTCPTPNFEGDLVVRASPLGITLFGNTTWITHMDELQEFAKTIDLAWREHLAYKKGASENFRNSLRI